jgi:hypothetical protein
LGLTSPPGSTCQTWRRQALGFGPSSGNCMFPACGPRLKACTHRVTRPDAHTRTRPHPRPHTPAQAPAPAQQAQAQAPISSKGSISPHDVAYVADAGSGDPAPPPLPHPWEAPPPQRREWCGSGVSRPSPHATPHTCCTHATWNMLHTCYIKCMIHAPHMLHKVHDTCCTHAT